MNAIRWHHKISTKKFKNAGIGEISQKDMVLTQYSLVAFVFIVPKTLAICNTLQENEAFNHFWRVNGYMLGISDRFNLCHKNAKETIKLCQKIKSLYAIYLSKAPPESCHILLNALNALWYITFLDKDVAISYIYESHGLPYKKRLGWFSWLILKYSKLTRSLTYVPYVREIIRICSNYGLLFIFWNAQNFPVLAWLKFGKNNVQINLYSKH